MTRARGHDEGVLKALSNSTRREIVNQIAEKGSATYTEIMQVLGLDPPLESGRFNYHLKELADAGLIERVNGDYQLTDLGTKALVLLDQVRDEPLVDRHGVLSAAISMSPREEIRLFANQMKIMLAIMSMVISPIVAVFSRWLTPILLLLFFLGLVLALQSGSYLYNLARRHGLGLSTLLLLDQNWFLIRSPNRGNFLAFTAVAVTSLVVFVTYIMLAATGVITFVSRVGVAMLGVSILLAPIAFVIAVVAIQKAEEMESTNREQ
ncbi:MAG: winged helix-turn-helix transcriptional regulator [Candidatus Thorarchaeota archaeon]|nr:MAG: winged helix-turn-helix transcriptional regulator [Candidatus Thorarchaeota archaeon]